MQGSAFALIDLVFLVLDIQVGVGSHVSFDGALRVVAGAIVGYDNLLLQSADQFNGFHFVENQVNRPLFVVGGNDNGQDLAHLLQWVIRPRGGC